MSSDEVVVGRPLSIVSANRSTRKPNLALFIPFWAPVETTKPPKKSYLSEPKELSKFLEEVVKVDTLKYIAYMLGTLAVPLVILLFFIIKAKRSGAEMISFDICAVTSLHCCFGFVIGWINTISLLRYNVFATMMVGNTVLMGVTWVCNAYPAAHSGLCPEATASVRHYSILIGLFLLGSILHGWVDAKFQCPTWYFAPVVVAGVFAEELLASTGVISAGEADLYMLSPIFGITASITSKSGIGSVPFATTGNMVSVGYHWSRYFITPSAKDKERFLVNFFLWLSFFLGILAGCIYETEFSLMCNTLALGILFIANSVVFPLRSIFRESSTSALPSMANVRWENEGRSANDTSSEASG